ncbi:HNH endonuclease family protein [Corynebacterium sphenisci]|uniref:HNH endonuclease family protein n=1 Tax=Corynebacterium sphenisci TaxID=191493 RepID=UPI0026DFF106|nr:HNH endonuclease family protein [Corynebacterium sphenisci]MDO5731311.1 HNH endonuclease family protein [Corynebacterium sphenisci]
MPRRRPRRAAARRPRRRPGRFRLSSPVLAPALALLLLPPLAPPGAGPGPPPHRVARPADPAALRTLLGAVPVTAERVTVTGYRRAAFGDWARAGACTTRQSILVRDFGGPPCRPGDRVIADPYTGAPLVAGEAEVDHVYPLAAAWDFGAHSWSDRRRAGFANDPLNLLPTAAAANRAKSDLTPAEWLPAPAGACGYALRYLRVARKWALPVSAADYRALAGACGLRVAGAARGAPGGGAGPAAAVG